tara:strand:+ start:3394 stop:4281 length:888 start_codon:yes stop_codon:yes gene_type:complete
MLKILIIGASGFIGSEFISRFSNDFRIISYSRNTRKNNKKTTKNIINEKGTIEDNKIIKIIKKHSPDIVLHLANFGSMKQCEENAESAFKTNVYGIFNVIMGCINTNSKLIFVSSREVYGETKGKNSSETDPILPNNVLGITKALAENLIVYANRKHALEYTILRPSNIYGINGEKFVIKTMLNSAMQKKKIFVDGGTQKLNLVHVNDVLDIIKLVIQKPKLSSGQIFNVGSNNNISVKRLALNIAKLVGGNVDIKFKKSRKNETQFYKPNIEKIEKVFEYTNWVNLNDGIKEML